MHADHFPLFGAFPSKFVDASVHEQSHIYIYSTLFKIQERKSDRRSKEIYRAKKGITKHTKQGRTCDLTALTLNYLATGICNTM